MQSFESYILEVILVGSFQIMFMRGQEYAVSDLMEAVFDKIQNLPVIP